MRARFLPGLVHNSENPARAHCPGCRGRIACCQPNNSDSNVIYGGQRVRQDANFDRGKPARPPPRVCVGIRKAGLFCPGFDDIKPEIEFVIADGAGIVLHRVHHLDHASAFVLGRNCRSNPIVTPAQDQKRTVFEMAFLLPP